jgi:hypothetical protein
MSGTSVGQAPSKQYTLPNIMMIKSWRMRLTGDVNAYKMLVGKPDIKKPLGRPRSRWDIILKWIVK